MLSDDSHGVAQVGLNYHRLWSYIRDLGITDIYTVEIVDGLIETKATPVTTGVLS